MTSTVVPSIGEPVVRIDGWVKASGAHIYPSDFVVEGMLWLRGLLVRGLWPYKENG
jgi:hypothetical protein